MAWWPVLVCRVRRVWRSGCVAWLVLSMGIGCSMSADSARSAGDHAFDGGVDGLPGAGGGFGGGAADASAPEFTEDRSVVQCDSPAAVTSCGGVSCPGPDPFAAQSCQLVCCTTDGSCGLRAIDDGVCTAQPGAGDGCPDATLDLGGGAEKLRGCCTASGTCGAVAFGECLSRARLDLEAVPCEFDDAGVDDAGSAP
jgi:hypothetical protein